jgi:hypothetical protein
MNTMNTIITWLSNPVNDILVITYVTAIMQVVASETGWRWAEIVAKIFASLPGINAQGLITAAKQ